MTTAAGGPVPTAGTPARVPAGLGAAGRRLWRDVTAGWDLSAPELVLLERAARTLDDVVRLERALVGESLVTVGSAGQARAHPLLPELARYRKLLADHLRQLALPDDDDGPPAASPQESPATRRARHAAEARWRLERDGIARRGA